MKHTEAYRSYWLPEARKWVRAYASTYAYVMRKHLSRSKY